MTSVCPTCGETYAAGEDCKRCLADQPTRPPTPAGPSQTLLAPATSFERHGVPGYEVLLELGRGGMGVVYKARHLKLDRIVALKMILAGGHATDAELARFRTEAEAIARLQHPNVVQVFEVGEHEGQPFFSLEYCPGGDLDGKLAGTPQPPRQAAELVRTLALAVQAAHDAGVIHRDLKPANVLLGADGTPKITDFGLAKKLDEKGKTQTGAVMGTPSYLAPEQAEGKKDVGPLADVYALGAILYECLTGRPPFKAATPLETMMQVIAQEPVPPRSLVPATPRDPETIALKCLEKAPAQRYESARALADDLGRFLADEPIEARRPGLGERLWRRARKQGRQAMATAAVTVGLALTLIVVVLGWGAYRESQKGELELTTDGPLLTAEVLREDSVVARFRVPTVDPVRLDPGTYRLRLAAPGWPSQEANVLILPGGKHAFDADVLPRECWPALDHPSADVRRPMPLRSGGLLVVEGKAIYSVDGSRGTRSQLATFPVEMLAELDWPDPFPHALHDGSPTELPVIYRLGANCVLSSWTDSRVSGARILTLLPAEKGKRDAIISAGSAELARMDPDGKVVWRGPPCPGGSAVLGKWKGQPALIVANATMVLCLDPATGKELSRFAVTPPRQFEFGAEPVPRFLEIDGNTVVLWAPRASEGEAREAVAYSPSANRVLWRKDDVGGVLATPPTKSGQDVLLLRDGNGTAPRGWSGIERVSGGDGQSLWQVRLVKHRLAGRSFASLQAVVGPDLDGDGEPDVFVASDRRELTEDGSTLHLHALSGSDGRTLWHRRLDAADGVRAKPLLWWPGGPGGLPRLVVPQEGYSWLAPDVAKRIDVFDCADGKLLHRIGSAGRPVVLDLDGDGLADLTYLVYSQATGGREFQSGQVANVAAKTSVKLRAIRGEPPTAWRWMGRWEPISDLDGDGLPEFLRRERDGSLAVASGATGRILWPGGSIRAKGGPSEGGMARLAAAGTVLSPPGALGDLDDKPDGVPDLIVVDRRRNSMDATHPSHALLPIRFVSAATGKPMWPAGHFEAGAPVSLWYDSSDQAVQVLRLTWLPVTPEPLVLARVRVSLQNKKTSEHHLVALSARSGKVAWHQELAAADEPEGQAPILTTAAGRQVLIQVEKANKTPVLVVRDLATGVRLAALEVIVERPGLLGIALLPGKPDTILHRVGNSLYALAVTADDPAPGKDVSSPPAITLKERWHKPASPPLEPGKMWGQEDFSMRPGWSPPVTLRGGQGRLIVYAEASREGGFGLTVVDENGKTVGGWDGGQGIPNLHVAELAGGETLLVVSPSRVRALRVAAAGAGLQVVWTWQYTQREVPTSLLDAGEAGLTVHLEGEALVGLDGATGRAAWTHRLDGGTALPSTGSDVFCWPGRQTVRHLRSTTAAPPYRQYPLADDDPRSVRRLPWVELQAEAERLSEIMPASTDSAGKRAWGLGKRAEPLRWRLLTVGMALGLFGLVLPARLFYAARRATFWRRLLIVSGWVAVVWLLVVYLGPLVYLWVTGMVEREGLLLLRAGLLAVAGLPLVQAAWSLIATLRRRDAWRLLRLLLTWAGSCALLAAVMLIVDHGSLEEQRYTFDGWYVLWLPGVYLLGLLLILTNLGRGLWRAVRGKREKQAAPAPAAL